MSEATDRLDGLLTRWFKACTQMRLDNAHHADALPALTGAGTPPAVARRAY